MKPQEAAGQIRMALVLVLVLASGWYFARVSGALASLLVFLLTVFAASHFVYTVHDMPSRRDAFQAMFTYLFGLNYPVVEISEGRLAEKSRGTPGARLGGPGIIKVAEDSAAVLVRGKEVRVIGPGTHVTKRGEKVKEAVDLRPQTRADTVKAMTKDGFEIELMFIVGFQIDTGGRQPTLEQAYPFSEQAILRAVYQSKQVGKDGAQTWDERVPGAVFGNVREMIATHYLEDFFDPENPGSDPRAELKQWLVETSKGTVANVGARLNWVSFSTPSIPDDAIRQYVERWQAKLQSKIDLLLADTESMVVLERARTRRETAALEANMEVIRAEAETEAETIKKRGEAMVEAERLRQLAEALQAQGLSENVIVEVLSQIARQPRAELEIMRGLFVTGQRPPDVTPRRKLTGDQLKRLATGHED